MASSDFPSNSVRRPPRKEAPPKAEAEPKKIERVIEGEVIFRKKPLGTRFRETFLGGSDRSVIQYVVQDVVIPGIRDMFYEAGVQSLERTFYGETLARRPGVRFGVGDPRRNGPTNYNAATARRPSEPAGLSRRARANHDFGEIVIGTRPEAEEILEAMFETLNTYEVVSVADLYNLIGQTSQFTDRNWGWTDLRGSDIRRVREGWLLNLPRTESIA